MHKNTDVHSNLCSARMESMHKNTDVLRFYSQRELNQNQRVLGQTWFHEKSQTKTSHAAVPFLIPDVLCDPPVPGSPTTWARIRWWQS